MRRIVLGLLAVALIPLRPAAADPRAWNDALSGVADTVVFLGQNGGLWRAPFHLGSREVLWSPRPGEHLVRLSMSPDGRHLAFITRIAEEDTSWIWIGGPDPPTIRGTFASVLPYRWNHLHFEPFEPTQSDRGYHGARFLQVGSRRWVRSSNTLGWTADARGVVFGYNDGVAFADADSARAVQVSRALPMDLLVLDPAPMVLLDAIVLREGLREGSLLSTPEDKTIQGMRSMNESMLNPTLQGESWYLLYPTAGSWRAFPSSGLDADHKWTASENEVWWVAGRVPHPSAGAIRTVRAHDPTPVVEVQGKDPVVWLGFDPASHSLLWASGGSLQRKSEGGGAATPVFRTAGTIARVLPVEPGRYALCTRDSVHLVDARTGDARSSGLAGLEPDRAFPMPGGGILLAVDGDGGHPATLARMESTGGALEVVVTPPVKKGRWAATPSGTHLVLFEPGRNAPGRIQVYEIASRRWIETANPGITGWEEIPAR